MKKLGAILALIAVFFMPGLLLTDAFEHLLGYLNGPDDYAGRLADGAGEVGR